MKILIYGINFSPELTGTGKYTGEMAEWFLQQGHEVRVITAPPYYPEWSIPAKYNKYWYKIENNDSLKIYRCPLFVPSKLSTLKRLLHLGSFALSSLWPLLLQIKWRPKIIICVVPTLFCVPSVLLVNNFTKSKVVLHVQDFEVEAMLGLGMAKKGVFSSIASFFEKCCLSAADKVSTISRTMIKKTLDKGVKPGNSIFFPNWSEINRFSDIDIHMSKKVKESLSLPEKTKIILYSGNVGEKQGLEIVITLAKELQNENLSFVIVGNGGGKARLEKLAIDNNLSNVFFRPLVAYESLPGLLKAADCHLVIQRKGAADAVLPSKLTNILAAGGNAVITADEQTELGQLCQNYPGIAILVEPESVEALKLGIITALKMPNENVIAKSYASQFLNKDTILNNFFQDIK